MQLQKAVLDALFLFNQSPDHRQYSLAHFNHSAIFPILYGKCRLFYDQDKPVAFVSWCWLTQEEGKDFLNETFSPSEEHYQRPDDPDAGLDLWGIEFIAPYGNASKVMRSMRHHSQTVLGTTTPAHWRRFRQPDCLHRRRF